MKRRPTTSLLGSLTTIALLAACAGGGDANGDSVLATDTAARQDSAAAQAQASSQALLDPNAATREQLAAVPGMPAHAVDAIVAGRPYENMVAVDRALAAHVADTTARNGIYGHVFKPIDLNAASDEEILLIPGIGSRMLHEFK
jgi:DNA uptake protein ComE-like DNA-binding protein